MVNRNGLIIPFLMAAFYSSMVGSPCMASVTIGGMRFDSAVVNDNASQATPANYSCTQSGGAITLSGQQPRTTANVTYFYNHASHGDERKFMVGINISSLSDTNSLAGIMYYSGPFVSSVSEQCWCRIGITRNRRVYMESHNLCDPPQKILLCTLSVAVTTAYIMAKIEHGDLNYYLSKTPVISDSALRIGWPMYFSYEHSFGFFLEPHVTTGYERAVFNSV